MTAKKKNTLKDLNAFLKQEATSLVTPNKVAATETPETTKKSTRKTPKTTPTRSTKNKTTAEGTITQQLKQLKQTHGNDFMEKLYDIIIEATNLHGNQDAKDKMLINTLLYLKDQDNWRENVKNYWEDHL